MERFELQREIPSNGEILIFKVSSDSSIVMITRNTLGKQTD